MKWLVYTVVGREGMLREGMSGFEAGVGGARSGEVELMCLLCGIGGVGGREVGVRGVEWVMCWGCCVVWGWGVCLGGVLLLMGFFCSAGWVRWDVVCIGQCRFGDG